MQTLLDGCKQRGRETGDRVVIASTMIVDLEVHIAEKNTRAKVRLILKATQGTSTSTSAERVSASTTVTTPIQQRQRNERHQVYVFALH